MSTLHEVADGEQQGHRPMEAAKDPGVPAVSSRWDRLRAVAEKMLKLKFTYKVAIALVTSSTAAYASVIWYCLAEGVPVFDLLEVAGPGIILFSSITWFILTATALVLLMPGIMRLLDPGHRHPVANDTEAVVERRTHFCFLLAVVSGSIAYSLFVMPLFIARMNVPEMTPWLDGARWAFIVLMGSAWSKFGKRSFFGTLTPGPCQERIRGRFVSGLFRRPGFWRN